MQEPTIEPTSARPPIKVLSVDNDRCFTKVLKLNLVFGVEEAGGPSANARPTAVGIAGVSGADGKADRQQRLGEKNANGTR